MTANRWNAPVGSMKEAASQYSQRMSAALCQGALQMRSRLADFGDQGLDRRRVGREDSQALRGSTWFRVSRFCAASRMCSSTAFRAICGSPVAIASTTC